MKNSIRSISQYIPWLMLLLSLDIFSALLLWLADAQAFYAMAVVMVLATVLLFTVLCGVLLYFERKKEQAFFNFLSNPDEYHEELLLETVSLAQRKYIYSLSQVIQDKQSDYTKLQMQLNDYEEYVESWAHETKTPLSLLTLLLDNRRDELSETVSFKLDYIRNRMQESVDQMLFYSRLRGTKKDHLFEYIQIRICVEDALEDYQPLLEEQQFQICFCLPDDTVYSDRRGLYFILKQIISNAIKYCKAEPELRFESFQRDGYYTLCIKDNGVGVHDCDLPYLFEKGFTGESGAGRKTATGMGLYLVKEMAKELNITLHVNSEWGKGFEIQILFPVVCKG
jgi:signal transduction histidine kinase